MIYHIISYHYQSLYMIWQTYHSGFLIWYHYIMELYQKPLKDRHTWVGCWWVGDGPAVLTGNLWDLPWILLYFAPPPPPPPHPPRPALPYLPLLWQVCTSPSGYSFPVYSLKQAMQFPSLSTPPSQPLQGLHPFHDKILRLLHYVDTQLSLLWQIDILCALYAVFKCLSKWIHGYADSEMRRDYGSVYMRKLAPVWLSYQDDFLIFYDVYTMTGSFHIMFIWRYTSCW